MAVKNRRPVSISSASVTFSSPNTSYRAVNYPALSMFKALILPLLNGYDTVSQPMMACIPGNCRYLEPSITNMSRWYLSPPNSNVPSGMQDAVAFSKPSVPGEQRHLFHPWESVLLIYHVQQLAVDGQSLSHMSLHARSHHYSDCQIEMYVSMSRVESMHGNSSLLCLFLRWRLDLVVDCWWSGCSL